MRKPTRREMERLQRDPERLARYLHDYERNMSDAEWREASVSALGADVVREAEAIVEQRMNARRVEICDDVDGKYSTIREDLLGTETYRHRATRRRLYSIPALRRSE